MTAEQPASPAMRGAAYFDQWYADMAASPTRDAIMARTLGLPPELRFASALTWQGVADVRTRRELNHCIELGLPFMTGEAVTDLLEQPIGASPLPWLNLPLHDWSVTPEAGSVSSVA
jgi:hypothetical protein